MLPMMVMKIGRNEPCPCGSGKKYKKCCMQIHQSIEKAENNLKEKILRFSKEPRFEADIRDANNLFFEGREPDEGDMRMFIDWFIYDYRLKNYGKSIIELFYLEKLQNLSNLEIEILEERQNTVLGIYEVIGIERGRGVYIRDIFDNTEIFVNDVNSSKGMNKWDIIILRVITVGDKYYISGAACILPQSARAGIIQYAKEEFIDFKKEKPEATWRDFIKDLGYTFITFTYRKAAQPVQFATPEGDPIIFAKAIYKVMDYERAVDALQDIPGFEILDSGQNEIHFGWFVEVTELNPEGGRLIFQSTVITEEGEGKYKSMGDITINSNQLTLNCLSSERLERGKNLLKALGDVIEFQSESEEYPVLEGGKDKTPETGLEDPVLEELKRKFLEDHYRKWVDMSIPFLNGRTPRECSKTPEGKAKLDELLKVIENAEERRMRSGEQSYDVSKLREMLEV